MATFTTDPRIAYAQGMRKNYMERALSPIQLPQNPYGGSPLASALQRVTEGYLAGQEGRRAAELQKAQSSAQNQILGSLLGASRARTPAGGQYFEQFQAPVPGIAPGPGATQTQIRRVAIGDDGREVPVSSVSAENLQIAGMDPIQFKMLYDDARIKGDAATQAALEKELKVKLGEATRALALNPNDENTLNQVQQIRALLDPSGIATETIERRQTLGDIEAEKEYEADVLEDQRLYIEGRTKAEREYQETLLEDDLKRHQADREEDRNWKLEENRIARLRAAEQRMDAIEIEEGQARRNQEWKLANALERRKEDLAQTIAAEQRKFIDVYDEVGQKNVKIRVAEFDEDPSRYGSPASATEMSRSWVTITDADGGERNQHLTDKEIQKISEQEGLKVDKFVSPSRKYQYLGVYELGGEIIGEGVFNKWTGEKYIRELTEDGKLIKNPIPPGAEPRTEASLSAGIPNFSQFKKVSDSLIADETQIRSYARYMQNQDNTNVGIQRLADELVVFYKTFLNDRSKEMGLSQEQLALRVARGQLQGLLGGARVITVGPGVMTEQDARRVLANLGGDVTLLQNPEVVKTQISRMFNDKMRDYENNLEFYNYGVKFRYKRRGFKEKNTIRGEIDKSLFKKDVFIGDPEQAVDSQNRFSQQLQLPPSERFSRMSREELLAINRKSLKGRSYLESYIEALKNLKN